MSARAGWGLYFNFSMARSEGDGGFQAISGLGGITNGLGSTFRWMAHADLDGDNDDDIVFSDSDPEGSIWVVMNPGNSSSGLGTQYPTGTGTGRNPSHLIMKDINRDGRPDAVVANSGTGTIAVLLGGGGGTFSSALIYPARAGCTAVASADFNGDGKPDLACANRTANNVSVLLNTFP